MLSTSAPTTSTPSLLKSSLSPLPYYLAIAVGGRANGQYDAIPPDVAPAAVAAPPTAAAVKADDLLAPSSSPIDIPSTDKLSLTKSDDTHDLSSTRGGKQLSYDASTAAKEHDSHMHDTLHPTTTIAAIPAPLPILNYSSSFGQDSYFVYSRPGAAIHAAGVADGVGGWRSQGVDSGVISRAMMDKCRQQVMRWDVDSSTTSVRNDCMHQQSSHASALAPPSSLPAVVLPSALSSEWMLPFSLPARMMGVAYDSIKEEGVVKAGSTTACVLTLTAHRCMPSHGGADSAIRVPSSATSSPNRSPIRSAPTSPPSSPLLVATSAESRHQLSLDDEKSEEKDELDTGVLVSQPAVDDVVVSLSGLTSDSDDEGERMNEVAEQMHAASGEVPGVTMSVASTTQAASPQQKTSSSFWSAVGHLIDHSHSSAASNAPITSTTNTTTSTTPASASSVIFSPPPSRPPSPSSPPLYLSCASIGDSGFILFRHGRIIHRSDLQRTGRIVKQLAVIPPHLQGPVHRFCDDRPTDSTLSCHRTQPGDLLLAASDGLLDNLSAAGAGNGGRQIGFVPWARFFLTGGALDDENDREAIESQNRRLEGLLKECEIDYEGRDKNQDSDSAAAAGGGGDGFVRLFCDRLVSEATEFMNTMDGKPDDITVLVAQVCKI